jgi:hypothetical protein
LIFSIEQFFNTLAARLEKDTHGGYMEFRVELAQKYFALIQQNRFMFDGWKYVGGTTLSTNLGGCSDENEGLTSLVYPTLKGHHFDSSVKGPCAGWFDCCQVSHHADMPLLIFVHPRGRSEMDGLIF